jgi:hypothetical protein
MPTEIHQNNLKIHLPSLLLLVFLSITAVGCSHLKHHGRPTEFLQLTSIFPLWDNPIEKSLFEREYILCETNDFSIFRLPHLIHLTEAIFNENGSFTGERYIGTDTIFYYVACPIIGDSALLFDSLRDNLPRKIDIDSFYSSSTIFNLEMFVENILRKGIKKSTTSILNGVVMENYTTIPSIDSNITSDSTQIVLDPTYNNFRFTLSPQIDSISRKKLVRIASYLPATEKEKLNANSPHRILSFNMNKFKGDVHSLFDPIIEFLQTSRNLTHIKK